MGTGVFIQRPIPSLKLNDDSQLLISPILQNNKKSSYVIEGTVNGGASAIASMDELLSIQ
jgi:glycerol kinase